MRIHTKIKHVICIVKYRYSSLTKNNSDGLAAASIAEIRAKALVTCVVPIVLWHAEHMYVCMFFCMCVWVLTVMWRVWYVGMYVCTYAEHIVRWRSTCVYVYIFTYSCTFVHTYACMYACSAHRPEACITRKCGVHFNIPWQMKYLYKGTYACTTFTVAIAPAHMARSQAILHLLIHFLVFTRADTRTCSHIHMHKLYWG